MTLHEWTKGRGMQTAIGAVVLGLAACGWTYMRATASSPLPAATPSASIVEGALNPPPKPGEVNVLAAVASDVFSDERKAPAKRYRLPGEAEPAIPVEPARPSLLGTGVRLDGKYFATITFESSKVLFVYVGDYVGIYQVKSIERGKVVFTTAAGKEIQVLAPRLGS